MFCRSLKLCLLLFCFFQRCCIHPEFETRTEIVKILLSCKNYNSRDARDISKSCCTRVKGRVGFDELVSGIVEVAVVRNLRTKFGGEATDEFSMAVIGTAQPFVLGGIAALTAECGSL